MTPKRIQLRRSKGWRKRYRCHLGGWCWCWRVVGPGGSLAADHLESERAARAIAVSEYRWKALGPGYSELRGKDLACWCPLEDEFGKRVP